MAGPDPIPLQPHWVYGPVDSRRLGRSLGVNLLPADRKLCDMDCVYCQYTGPARETPRGEFPIPENVLHAVEAALARERVAGGRLDSITIAGNGEPTLHPRFAEIVAGLVELRDRLDPRAKLCLLSNGSGLRRAGVRAALESIDKPIFKLDAGTDDLFQAINRPRSMSLDDLLSELVSVPTLALQSMFVTGRVDNTTAEAVRLWFTQVMLLKPVEVQVTTVDRGTQVPGVLPVSAACLQVVASALRARGIEARAFPCRDPQKFTQGNGDGREHTALEDAREATLKWLVQCPQHGTRAHLEIADTSCDAPAVAWCSLFPDRMPAPCGWRCLSQLALDHEDATETRVMEPPM